MTRTKQTGRKGKRKAPEVEAVNKDYPAVAAAKKDYPAAGATKKRHRPNPRPSSSTLKPLKKIEKKDKNEGNYSKMKKEKAFGFIFMCNSKTKPECYKNRVFGFPRGKIEMVEKIQPGTRLFLFDIDVKLLYGIYKAESRGEMNLVGHAFDGNYPAQVKFSVEKDCLPIHESKFKQAILENYDSPSKFQSELSKKQVIKLLSLFKPVIPAPEPASPHYIHDKRPRHVSPARHVSLPRHLPPQDLHVSPPRHLPPQDLHVPLPIHLTSPPIRLAPHDMHAPPPVHAPPPMHLAPHPDQYIPRQPPLLAYLPSSHLPPFNEPYRYTRLPPEDPYLGHAAKHDPASLNDPYIAPGYARVPVSKTSDASLPVNDPYYRAGHYAHDLSRSVEHHARASQPVSHYEASYPYNQAESSRSYYARSPIRSDSRSYLVPTETIFNSNATFSDIARDYQFTTTSHNQRMI